MRVLIIVLMVMIVGAPLEASAGRTALPLPRFVSMKAEEANVRAGPGLEYPIKWILHQRTLPVEIVAEYDQWRKIRDMDGGEGWVHGAMLSGKRTVMVMGQEQVLRKSSRTTSQPLARVQPGVIGTLLECDLSACRIEVKKWRGWMDKTGLWGVYPAEVMD